MFRRLVLHVARTIFGENARILIPLPMSLKASVPKLARTRAAERFRCAKVFWRLVLLLSGGVIMEVLITGLHFAEYCIQVR